MANTNKTYFLVTSWDFPKGSVCLGSLTSSPTLPHIALFKPDDSGLDTPIYPTTKDNYTGIVRSEKGDKGGLFCHFMDLCGFGLEAGVKYDRKAVLKYSFNHMHTEWFIPSEEFIKKAVQSKKAASYLKRTGYESPLYMVSGLKVVEGASVTTLKDKGKDFRAFLGVDSGPVSVGPQANHTSQGTELHTFSNSTPIVFAFQLVEVRCDAMGNVSTKAYNSGALFGIDADCSLPSEELENTLTEQVTSKVLEKEFGDAFSTSAAIDEEDGSVCTVVWPKTATAA